MIANFLLFIFSYLKPYKCVQIISITAEYFLNWITQVKIVILETMCKQMICMK